MDEVTKDIQTWLFSGAVRFASAWAFPQFPLPLLHVAIILFVSFTVHTNYIQRQNFSENHLNLNIN